PGPLADPLVRGVHHLGQLRVRQHPLGDVGAEPGDRDVDACGGFADHRAAKVSVPRTASSSPTVAVARPRPTGPRRLSSSQVKVSSSPGETIRLKRTPSIPAKSASLPSFSGSESTATAPAWASASTMITPGL